MSAGTERSRSWPGGSRRGWDAEIIMRASEEVGKWKFGVCLSLEFVMKEILFCVGGNLPRRWLDDIASKRLLGMVPHRFAVHAIQRTGSDE